MSSETRRAFVSERSTKDFLQSSENSICIRYLVQMLPSNANRSIAQWCASLSASARARVRVPSSAPIAPFFQNCFVAARWALLVSEPSLPLFFSRSDVQVGSAQFSSRVCSEHLGQMLLFLFFQHQEPFPFTQMSSNQFQSVPFSNPCNLSIPVPKAAYFTCFWGRISHR